MPVRLSCILLFCSLLVVPAHAGQPDPIPTNEQTAVATSKFQRFAVNWMARVAKSYRCTVEKKEVVPRGNGFVARYFVLDPSTLDTRVKAAGSVATPFVGVMRYEEHLYECEGDTPQSASAGPFKRVERTRVTEIFRYDSTRWVGAPPSF